MYSHAYVRLSCVLRGEKVGGGYAVESVRTGEFGGVTVSPLNMKQFGCVWTVITQRVATLV